MSSQPRWTPGIAPNAVLSLVTAVTNQPAHDVSAGSSPQPAVGFLHGEVTLPMQSRGSKAGIESPLGREGLESSSKELFLPVTHPLITLEPRLSHLSHARGEPPPQPKSSKLQSWA